MVYIDFKSNYNHSSDNFVKKSNISLSLVTVELPQNTNNVITTVTYKLLNTKTSRQLTVYCFTLRIITKKAGNYVTTKTLLHHRNRVRKIFRIGEKQCAPKGQARYVYVRGSVQWKGVYRVGGRYWGCKIRRFLLLGEIF